MTKLNIALGVCIVLLCGPWHHVEAQTPQDANNRSGGAAGHTWDHGTGALMFGGGLVTSSLLWFSTIAVNDAIFGGADDLDAGLERVVPGSIASGIGMGATAALSGVVVNLIGDAGGFAGDGGWTIIGASSGVIAGLLISSAALGFDSWFSLDDPWRVVGSTAIVACFTTSGALIGYYFSRDRMSESTVASNDHVSSTSLLGYSRDAGWSWHVPQVNIKPSYERSRLVVSINVLAGRF